MMTEPLVALLGSLVGVGLFIGGIFVGIWLARHNVVKETKYEVVEKPVYTIQPPQPEPPKPPQPTPGPVVIGSNTVRPSQTQIDEQRRLADLLGREPEV